MSRLEVKTLRSQILKQRRQLLSEFICEASKVAAATVTTLPEFLQAQHIATYFPFDNEIDPRFILESAFTTKKVFLPVISESKILKFAPYFPQSQLIDNRYGIPEPKCSKNDLISVNDMDLLIVPLACFDKHCNRIGMGAGYYDNTLAQIDRRAPIKIGLAYEIQRVESTLPQSWDIPMDLVVTEKQIYRR
jgi:5-formyltetrahydrofolate cyclo-ligase